MDISALNQINYTSKNVLIYKSPSDIAKAVALRVATLIRDRQAKNEKVVLCLPTGSTPVSTYRELIRLHKEEGLSFYNVITFNLDEYYPMQPTDKNSYHKFMNDTFFKHVDIPRENIHIPDGTLPIDQVEAFCLDYEAKIQSFGGIDLALVGIGRTGHIGFNEPPSLLSDRTRMVALHNTTRVDAASAFGGEVNVPHKAITMGTGTVMDCREIILIATGENKMAIVKKALEDKLSSPSECPAAFLRIHKNATFYVDEAAGLSLKRVQCPWIALGPDQDLNQFWSNFEHRKKAIIYCALHSKKPICDLTENDFYEHELSSLIIYSRGEIDSLCREIFENLLGRITLQKNQKQLIPCDPSEKVLIFSPHPDDDVICMGGLMSRLVKVRRQALKEQNPNLANDSSVDCGIRAVYMTNGSVAVADNVLRYHLRFANLMATEYVTPDGLKLNLQHLIDQTLFGPDRESNANNSEFVDSEVRQKLKGNIRRSEAMNAVEKLGMNGDRDCIFLDLPFYHTGKVEKNPLSHKDVEMVKDLLIKENPKHIFVAADLTDPHGTHRCCYFAIKQALEELYPAEKRNEHTEGKMKVWLYRGAWQEFEPHETHVFLPMSRAEMNTKIQSIYMHQSQKHTALYPGNDPREFYERAQDRNTQTADILNHLGLPAFYACEAFVSCEPEDLPC